MSAIQTTLTITDRAGNAVMSGVQARVGELRLSFSIDSLGSVEESIVEHSRLFTITKTLQTRTLRPSHRFPYEGMTFVIVDIRESGSNLSVRGVAQETI